MSIIAYLNFSGRAKEAALYYAEVFESPPPTLMLFGDMPPDPSYLMTDAVKQLVMHTEIKIGTETIMISDVTPDMKLTMGNNISLLISLSDEETLTRYFKRLAKDGTISMPLQETFWSKCYGNLTDKFGVGWQFDLAES